MKKDEQYLLKKDSRWDSCKIDSIEYLFNICSKITFNPEVPNEITQRFNLVKKLILHSFFVYDFLDVAFQRSILTLEIALKQRHLELTGFNKTTNFYKLIKWGIKEGLFEDDERVINILRKFRNQVAHPNRHQLLGNLSLELIFKIVEIINGLYEDRELRKDRKTQEKQSNKKLEDFIENGAILEIDNQQFIIFKAVLLYCNNKIDPTIYFFLFWPIFNTETRNDLIDFGKPIIVRCSVWEIRNNIITFFDNSGRTIQLRPINNNKSKLQYNKWKKFFDENTVLRPLINIRIYELKNECKKLT